MQVTGGSQRKSVAEQYSLSCVLIFIALVQTLCGGLTLAGYQVPTQPLSLFLRDKARETS